MQQRLLYLHKHAAIGFHCQGCARSEEIFLLSVLSTSKSDFTHFKVSILCFPVCHWNLPIIIFYKHLRNKTIYTVLYNYPIHTYLYYPINPIHTHSISNLSYVFFLLTNFRLNNTTGAVTLSLSVGKYINPIYLYIYM